MSGYGRVISGGVQMRKGVTKGINDKLGARASEIDRRERTAKAVVDAYKVDTLSSQHTNNIHGGDKFSKPKQVKNI